MRGAIEGYFYRVLGFFARGSWKSKEGGPWYDSGQQACLSHPSWSHLHTTTTDSNSNTHTHKTCLAGEQPEDTINCVNNLFSFKG